MGHHPRRGLEPTAGEQRPAPALPASRRRRRAPALPARWRRSRRPPVDALRSVRQVARDVAGADGADIVLLDVARRLVELLDLSDCAFQRPPFSGHSTTVLNSEGEMDHCGVRWSPVRLGFPESGFDIVVVCGGETVGRYVCRPRHQKAIAEDRILAALALCDLAAAARRGGGR